MESDSKRSETSLDLSINLFPPSPRSTVFGTQSSSKLAREVNRMSSETKRLTQRMNSLKEKCCLLRSQVREWKSKNLERETPNSKKRKAEEREDQYPKHCTESSSSDEDSSCKRKEDQKSKTKVARVFVHTEASSDTSMGVKDGYQWRKYGQKVTRDNSFPRAYYKCSFSPTCPVKKKVQRSAEDPSVLIAVYQGQHNHAEPSRNEFSLPQNLTSSPLPPLTRPLSSSVFASSSSDSVEPGSSEVTIHQFLVQQMASSLRSDPIFAAAVAEAMSGQK